MEIFFLFHLLALFLFRDIVFFSYGMIALSMIILFIYLRAKSRYKYYVGIVYYCVAVLTTAIIFLSVRNLLVFLMILPSIYGIIYFRAKMNTPLTLLREISPRHKKDLIEKELAGSNMVYYVGNNTSKKFHMIDCPKAKKIPDMSEFRSVNAAEQAGFTPCDCVVL